MGAMKNTSLLYCCLIYSEIIFAAVSGALCPYGYHAPRTITHFGTKKIKCVKDFVDEQNIVTEKSTAKINVENIHHGIESENDQTDENEDSTSSILPYIKYIVIINVALIGIIVAAVIGHKRNTTNQKKRSGRRPLPLLYNDTEQGMRSTESDVNGGNGITNNTSGHGTSRKNWLQPKNGQNNRSPPPVKIYNVQMQDLRDANRAASNASNGIYGSSVDQNTGGPVNDSFSYLYKDMRDTGTNSSNNKDLTLTSIKLDGIDNEAYLI